MLAELPLCWHLLFWLMVVAAALCVVAAVGLALMMVRFWRELGASR